MNKFPDKDMYYIYFNTCFWDQLTPTELEDMLMDLDRRFKEMEEQGKKNESNEESSFKDKPVNNK